MGTRAGNVPEVCRRIAEELGVEVEFVEYATLEAQLQAVADGDVDLAADTVAVHNVQGAQADVLDAVFTVHHAGNGHGGVGVAEDAFADVADGNRDRIEGGAFALNDFAAGFADVVFHVAVDQFGNYGAFFGQAVAVLVDGNVGNGRARRIHKRERSAG